MIHKYTVLLLLSILFLIGSVLVALRLRVSEPSVADEITNEFVRKYKKAKDTIIITVDIDTGTYAKGSIRFRNEFGGALWFGAKQQDGWKLVADGQGPMGCELADLYTMPQDLVPECINAQGDVIHR